MLFNAHVCRENTFGFFGAIYIHSYLMRMFGSFIIDFSILHSHHISTKTQKAYTLYMRICAICSLVIVAESQYFVNESNLWISALFVFICFLFLPIYFSQFAFARLMGKEEKKNQSGYFGDLYNILFCFGHHKLHI